MVNPSPPGEIAGRSPYTGPVVEFKNVTVRYPGRHVTRPAVVGVDLAVTKGSFVTVVGPSGCGKSTLLHVCSGLLKPVGGEFRYLGQEWKKLHPGIGYVTQRETLLPWKTVLGNIALPLKIKGVARAERKERAAAMAASVGLGDWLDNYPRELSGGMRQRVQLGRVLVTNPTLLLMDEPFGALDAVLRVRMQEFLKSTIAGTDLTTIFVTHDLSEALTLGDQVVAMAGAPGKIDQIDYLEDLPRGVSAVELRRAPGLRRTRGPAVENHRGQSVRGWHGTEPGSRIRRVRSTRRRSEPKGGLMATPTVAARGCPALTWPSAKPIATVDAKWSWTGPPVVHPPRHPGRGLSHLAVRQRSDLPGVHRVQSFAGVGSIPVLDRRRLTADQSALHDEGLSARVRPSARSSAAPWGWPSVSTNRSPG